MQKTFSKPNISTDFLGEIKKNAAINFVAQNSSLYLDNQLNFTEKEKIEKLISLYPECMAIYRKSVQEKKRLFEMIPYKSLEKQEVYDLNLELKEIYANLIGKESTGSQVRLPRLLKKLLVAFNLY